MNIYLSLAYKFPLALPSGFMAKLVISDDNLEWCHIGCEYSEKNWGDFFIQSRRILEGRATYLPIQPLYLADPNVIFLFLHELGCSMNPRLTSAPISIEILNINNNMSKFSADLRTHCWQLFHMIWRLRSMPSYLIRRYSKKSWCPKPPASQKNPWKILKIMDSCCACW